MPVQSKPIVEFMFFDAGGGHRAAATALKQIIENRSFNWDVRLVNLQLVLDEIDVFRKVTSIRLEDIYNLLLKNGLTLGTTEMLPVMHLILKMNRRPQIKLLRKMWSETKPGMVVSLVPNFNYTMFQALKQASPGTPYVTILTDIADYPPNFWIEKDQNQYFICGSAKAEQQALSMGHPRDKVIRTSGMILNPRFYDHVPVDRAEARKKLGLDPNMPTALVMFGGMGSFAMKKIQERLDASSLDLQVIHICGNNPKLLAALKALQPGRLKTYLEGFTKEIPFYMNVADFMIGKPGPGSVSEAVAMGLPVITECNAWTLPQERYNAEWIRENKIGEVVKNFRHIVPAVENMLRPGCLANYRANAAAIKNRAAFEIPEILETILRCAPLQSPSPPPLP